MNEAAGDISLWIVSPPPKKVDPDHRLLHNDGQLQMFVVIRYRWLVSHPIRWLGSAALIKNNLAIALIYNL